MQSQGAARQADTPCATPTPPSTNLDLQWQQRIASTRLRAPHASARCSLPRARKEKDGSTKGDPKYQITVIFDDPDELREMKAAARAKGEEKFGVNFMNLVKKGKANWPFGNNTDKEDDNDVRIAGFENDEGQYVSFKSGDKPGVVDADAEPIMDKSEIYDGMRCRVSCRPFAYDNESKGVAFFLINVQKLGDGDRLSGDPSAEDDFKPAKKAGAKKPAKKGNDDYDGIL